MCCKSKKYDHWELKVNNINDMLTSFDKEIDVEAEIFISDTINMLNPFSLKIIENYLLTENMIIGNGKLVSVYDMNTKQYLGDFLSRGKGPNEFIQVRLCNYSNDTILALDIYRKEALLFSKTKIKRCDQFADRKISFKLNEKADQINQCFLDNKNNQLICSGQFMNGRFQSFDTNGKFIKYFGIYPKASYNGKLDNYHLGYVYGTDASFASNVRQDKFACSERYALCIYEKSPDSYNKLFEVQWAVSSIRDAAYKNGKPYVLRDGDDMIGSGNLAATKNYVFAPFSNYSHRDVMKLGIENRYSHILVLDWNGTPIGKLKLDKEIQFPLEIDKEGKFLYGIHTDPLSGFSQIIRFNLNCLDEIR